MLYTAHTDFGCYMQKILSLFKNNVDLSVALVLAVLSSFGPNVSLKRIEEGLNTKILLLLLCLMLVVAGFRKLGVLDYLYKKCFIFVNDARSLSRLFIFVCFFFSMLITNDVSLIIFVPLAIKAFIDLNRQDLIILVVSLQTIAANAGSMLTPIGNPQNLFIYSFYHYDLTEFLKVTAPVFTVCAILLYVSTAFIDKTPLILKEQPSTPFKPFRTVAFVMLFILCIMAVLRIIDVYDMALVVLCSVLVVDVRMFRQADYKLLLLFTFLFIFVSNICTYALVADIAHQFVKNYEYFVSLSLSQIISNVPATVMLAEFALDSDALLKGVNVGGMGTCIASMASLISFKAYMKVDGSRPLYYLRKFTKLNIEFLVVLVPLHLIFPSIF